MKAIIIGGGIAGLAAARGLQLLNWEVKIYEQAPELTPAGAGIVLSANALKALQAIRLYDPVVAKGNPIDKFDILDEKGNTLTSTNHLLLSKKFGHVSGITLHRRELQEVLLSQLSSLTVQTGKQCRSINQTPEGVEVEFNDGELVQADILLGCDGIHSAVRENIFPGSQKRFAGYTCWRGVASSRPASQHPKQATESWGRGRRFGIVPLTENRVYWFACLNTPLARDPKLAKMDLNDLQQIFTDFHEPVKEVLQKTPPEALLLNDIMDLKPIPSFSKGRVVLLGDAAHATTPNMGQGACQALEDVAVLSALLQKYEPEKAFIEYNKLRVPRTHEVVNKSWQLGKIAHWENPIAVSFRNLLLKNLPDSVNERQLNELLNVRFEPVAKISLTSQAS